ncbi:MAG: hypothetical protein M3N31_00135, partial [Actinomycetota bacterium]|nr:hypothetical protein [Actinomycetota bacterium]
ATLPAFGDGEGREAVPEEPVPTVILDEDEPYEIIRGEEEDPAREEGPGPDESPHEADGAEGGGTAEVDDGAQSAMGGDVPEEHQPPVTRARRVTSAGHRVSVATRAGTAPANARPISAAPDSAAPDSAAPDRTATAGAERPRITSPTPSSPVGPAPASVLGVELERADAAPALVAPGGHRSDQGRPPLDDRPANVPAAVVVIVLGAGATAVLRRRLPVASPRA